ncbi:hypothetical protein MAR_018359 [Mya arenaria]|uniref:Uncharacterized protein n=1 Tax=Mya arenaria TaxID=6604 RepID=A0ABY7EHX5_MYAAR|nr:hypothetical protein MAR_018359 [Mya arenaria]
MYELTTVMRQKYDAEFAHRLNRISRNSDVNEYNAHALTKKAGQTFTSVASDYTQGKVSASGEKNINRTGLNTYAEEDTEHSISFAVKRKWELYDDS